ncbi:MAG: glycosyltransferase family 9 protein [Bacteroidota bacterium]|jgi:ADP-heptose:LPS heptosyltransferase
MKILILRFSSIGDIVLTSPIIRCVKNQIPNAEIHYLTKETYSNLITHNTHITKLHALNDHNFNILVEDLKKENFDLVIDLHKNIRTFKIKRAINTKWFSFNKLNFKKWLFVHFKIDLLPDVHIIDRYFDGLKSLNIKNDNQGVEYHLPRKLAIDLKQYHIQKKQYIVLSLGATYYTKQIPNNVLLMLLKRLNDSHVVLIGAGDKDTKKADFIMKNSNHKNIINLCNKLTIDESAYIIKHSKTIITGDTGMMHIASCFDVDIITLWGNTHPKLGMHAYVSKEKVQNHLVNLACHPCSKLGSDKCPRGHFNCMNMQDTKKIVLSIPK